MATNSNIFFGKAFKTPEFRLSYPHFFAVDPYTVKPGKAGKYNCVMVMPPEAMKEIRKQLKLAAEGKWGPDRAKWPASLRKIDLATYCSPNAKDGWPIRDGDDSEKDGYAGMQYVKAGSSKKPEIVDIKLQPILDINEAHAGVVCRALVQAYAYEGDSAGVTLALEKVLVVRDDGTNWGGGGGTMSAADAFSEFMDDGSDDAGNYATGTDDL
jgi:hypothetical protein